MSHKKNILTEQSHWENNWAAPIRMRLPRKVSSGIVNIMRLLKSHVRPGCKYLEIGCAPGKLLAWVAVKLNANVSGMDYSSNGMQTCRELFEQLSITGDLRCENIFDNSFAENSFDMVFSNGVIEHFEDPRNLIQIHLKLLKPGGKALIVIPNYSGLYLKMQQFFDPENLEIHNLSIMSPDQLLARARIPEAGKTSAYYYGNFSPGLISWHKKIPAIISRVLTLGFDGAGMLQPFRIKALCPNIILEIEKKRDTV